MTLPSSTAVDLPYQLTKGFAARFIRYKAARLVGRAGIRPCDREDLEQEMKLHLVERSAKFDPAVAHWNAFVVTVISRYVLTLLVKRRRGKRRQDLPLASLDELAGNTGDAYDDPEMFAHEDHVAQSNVADGIVQHDLAIDVQDVLDRLPRCSRDLCERLMRDSPAEVARQMRVPRTTLYGRIFALRPEFEPTAGKSEKNPPSLFGQTQ